MLLILAFFLAFFRVSHDDNGLVPNTPAVSKPVNQTAVDEAKMEATLTLLALFIVVGAVIIVLVRRTFNPLNV